eukprot:scaffold68250_cov36-Phaeocystis_antarctica.AAC.1
MTRHRRSCGERDEPSELRCASRSARRAAWPARRAAAACVASAVSTTSGLGLTVARVVEDALSVTAAATCDLRSALPVRSRVHGTTPSFFFSPARATTGGCERRAAERVKLCRAAAHLSFEPPTSRSRSRLDLGVLPQCEAARCRKRKRGSAP